MWIKAEQQVYWNYNQMQYYLFIVLILFISWGHASEKELLMEEQLAEAYFAARDYSKSAQFYESRLEKGLPKWQEALANYNLSTLSLVEKGWKEVFSSMGRVSFDSISSPALLERMMWNQSLAYFQKALSTTNNEQRLYYLQTALNGLQDTEKVICYIQKLEMPELEVCQKSSVLAAISAQIEEEQQNVKQKLRNEILIQGNLNTALGIVNEALERLIQLFDSRLKSSEKIDTLWIQKSAESLSDLWKNLIEQPMEQKQIKEVEAALNAYLEGLKGIQAAKWSEALAKMQASKEKIAAIQSQLDPEQLTIDHLILSYKLLLNQNFLSHAQVGKILEDQKKLDFPSLNKEVIATSTTYLEKGLKELEGDKLDLGRFYLLLAFYQLQTAISKNTVKDSAGGALTQIIDQTSQALTLSRFSNQEKDAKIQEEIFPLIKENLNTLMVQANDYIGVVLKEEKERFQKMGVIEFPRCQDKPWDLVIPLFEEGFEHAKIAQEGYQKDKNREAIQNLEVALFLWQQALDLLRQWKKFVNKPMNQAEEQNAIPSNMQTLFQSLQEMYLDDSSPQETQKDFHAW